MAIVREYREILYNTADTVALSAQKIGQYEVMFFGLKCLPRNNISQAKQVM